MICASRSRRGGFQGGWARALICALSSSWLHGAPNPEPQDPPAQAAPPTAVPIVAKASPLSDPSPIELAGLSEWTIGQPTDEEQLYLELVNRSRRDPPAEGRRLRDTTDPVLLSAYKQFGVDTNLLAQEFAAIAPAPPLSMSGPMIAAARGHSQWMFDNNVQLHEEGTIGPGARLTAQGYPWVTYGENIFWKATSVMQGHAALNVDWGAGPGGMQTGRGHRVNIHHPAFYEIGVGILNGTHGTPNSAGPQVLTEDFGAASGTKPFVTGVAYFDLNHNGFYDLGEGLGGVKVNVSGANFYATTSDSGGYSVPVPGNGKYSVTFTANGLSPVQISATVSNARSVKVDFVPTFQPASISGPTATFVGRKSTYLFTPTTGATAYEWKRSRLLPLTTAEGAEAGLGDLQAVSTAGYPVIVTDVVASGAKAFHLAHPSPPTDQTLKFTRHARPRGPGSLWRFSSRLGWAGSAQLATAQISADGGGNWINVWTRAGTGNKGQTTFETITVSLAGFAGQEIQTRFVYKFQGGEFFPQTTAGVGWYLDNISFVETDALVDTLVEPVSNPYTFDLAPPTAGTYLLTVSSKAGNRTFPPGPPFTMNAAALPNPAVEITKIQSPGSKQVVIDFRILQGTAKSFQLESASSAMGPWGVDTHATIQALTPGSVYRATTTVPGSLHVFRLRAL